MSLRRVVNLFRSLKTTVWLIVSLVAVFFAGLAIPQKALLGGAAYLAWKRARPGLVGFLESLHLTDIYVSPLALLLFALFFLNLIAVMADRVPAIWRRCRRVEIGGEVAVLKGSRHYREVAGRGIADLAPLLAKSGYAIFSDEAGLTAVRNRFAPLCTLLFHLSFFFLLLGGVATFYTRFRAEADVAVGETFTGTYTRILKRPMLGGIPATRFTVDRVAPAYYRHTLPVDLRVDITSAAGTKGYGINHPFRDGPLSFVISDIDVAPLFVVQDREGRETDGVYAKLKVLGGGEDSFNLDGYTFKTLFYPDYTASAGAPRGVGRGLPQALTQFAPVRPKGEGREIVDPAFAVSVYRDGRLVGSGLLRPGGALPFDGRRLVWKDLRYWVHFYAGQEHGLLVVYAGFALMTLALALRFGFYRRDIRAVAAGGTLHVAGRAEYYPALFADEFDGILAGLAAVPPPDRH